jgi:hypothetical protein
LDRIRLAIASVVSGHGRASAKQSSDRKSHCSFDHVEVLYLSFLEKQNSPKFLMNCVRTLPRASQGDMKFVCTLPRSIPDNRK